jgi:hypothetical protein
MNPRPTSGALAKSAGKPGNATGRIAPIAISAEPTRIGQRVPMRSDTRPAATESSIAARVQRHQHTDRERRGPHRQRVERHDDAAAAEHRVIRDPEQDQQASVRVARTSPTVTWDPRRFLEAAPERFARKLHGTQLRLCRAANRSRRRFTAPTGR